MSKINLKNIRVGHGYDTHRLSEGREFILGGVTIPFDKGLDGHSDADVLIHAIIDAILGATAQGDIGQWFPDTDPSYKDSCSKNLLDRVWRETRKLGWELVNLDSIVFAQAPKIQPHIATIITSLASILDCEESQVGIKATTGEKIGFVGRGEGVSASATLLLYKKY